MNPHERHRITTRVLAEEMAKPYIYGKSDCFALGCRQADAMDPSLKLSKKYLGTYDSLAGAQRALRRAGHRTLQSFWGAILPSCAPAEARLGDVGVVQVGKAQHVVVFLGTRLVSKGENGRSEHSLSECIAAFRTGD